MSLSSALSSAFSGLTAASRAAEVISNNIANAATPGYGRREIQLSVAGRGQGVMVTGITRSLDRYLLSDRRLADAASGAAQTRVSFFSAVEAALGTADSAASLNSRIDSFDAALITAAGQPGSDSALTGVLNTAQDLVAQINTAGAAIQTARAEADARIAAQVETLNTTLARVAELNSQIQSLGAGGGDVSALIDQRQQQIDSLSAILPVREIDRGDGVLALYTPSGAALVEGKASVFGFSASRDITPEMTLGFGTLSGLVLNGRAISAGDSGLLSGGSLASDFALRDTLAPAAQAKLDAVAQDLVTRFSASGLDPTLTSGAPGLFTDAGAALEPDAITGLAQRLKVNSAVVPAEGGRVTRLRDGLGATTVGPSGESGLLTRLQGALSQGAGGFSAAVSNVVSAIATDRLDAESDASFASARATGLHQQELAQGVDTDQEMQQLLLVEQAFSANARVMQAAGDMINTLLEI